jgi:spermidine synthase
VSRRERPLQAHSEEVKVLEELAKGRSVPAPFAAVVALVGASAIVAQIILLRELMVCFGGNEMAIGVTLSTWLLWTAVGSGLLSRLARDRDPHRTMAVLQLTTALLLPCTVIAVRASRSMFHAIPGEVLGPVPMLLVSVGALSAFCCVSGWLFAVGARLLTVVAESSGTASIGSMYLLEAAGSAVGGMIASLFLLPYLDSFQIVVLLGMASVAAATFLLLPQSRFRTPVYAILLLLLPALLVFASGLNRRTLAAQWPGFRLLASANSRYGSLAVLGNDTGKTIVENGLPIVSVPDPQAAEETVHFALLQHSAPRSLLLIGGGLNGSLQQALRHPTMERVDYVELDPEILRLARRHLPAEWRAADDARVHVHSMDGRLFLKTTRQSFDVIIASLPDPQTAQLNRFFTQEFFQEAAGRLTPGGVLSFQMHASENYISPELAQLLRCVRTTLRQTFADVAVIPGDTAVFLASTRSGMLTTRPVELVSRLRARRLQTAYVREYYLPFRMAPDRVADLEQQLAPQPGTHVNGDFTPVAYYFDVVLWSGQFSEIYRKLFATMADVPYTRALAVLLLLMLLGAGLVGWRGGYDRQRGSVALCVAAMGFTLLALEVLLLLGFQAIYGYMYHQLAIIIAAFMAGMTLGSWLALRFLREARGVAPRRLLHCLAVTQVLATLSPLIFYGTLAGLTSMGSATWSAVIGNAVFPLLALFAGSLGGWQFPLANRIYFDERETARPGTLYAVDLAGACAGALLISAYVVPVFGFLKTGELIALVNLVPAAMALISSFHPTGVHS